VPTASTSPASATHAKACPICQPWQGRLVSLDGKTTEYLGEAVTDLASLPNGGPPFHPNCAALADARRGRPSRRPGGGSARLATT
jgi:hypothetical protein